VSFFELNRIDYFFCFFELIFFKKKHFQYFSQHYHKTIEMADSEYQNKLKKLFEQYLGKKLVSDDTYPVPEDVMIAIYLQNRNDLLILFIPIELSKKGC